MQIMIVCVYTHAEPSVYLTLRNNTYTTNNSDILITDIGSRPRRSSPAKNSLACHTSLDNCCREGIGKWFFPNGSKVLHQNSKHGDELDLYFNRGNQIVALNRRNNATGPTGLYCCVVKDNTNETQTFCANIGIN